MGGGVVFTVVPARMGECVGRSCSAGTGGKRCISTTMYQIAFACLFTYLFCTSESVAQVVRFPHMYCLYTCVYLFNYLFLTEDVLCVHVSRAVQRGLSVFYTGLIIHNTRTRSRTHTPSLCLRRSFCHAVMNESGLIILTHNLRTSSLLVVAAFLLFYAVMNECWWFTREHEHEQGKKPLVVLHSRHLVEKRLSDEAKEIYER